MNKTFIDFNFSDTVPIDEYTLKELINIKTALDEHSIVSIADAKGRIIYANKKFVEISKYSLEDLLGQDHRIVNSGFHSKEFMKNLWQTIKSGKQWQGEVRNRAKDGSYYWVDTIIVPFVDKDGVPYQFVSIRTDITARVLAQEKANTLLEELKNSNKSLTDFAYVVSHDLKAPLRSVSSLALWLLEDYKDKLDKDGVAHLNLMVSRIQRMNQMIEGVLQYSRIGRETVEPLEVNLNELVNDVINLFTLQKDMILISKNNFKNLYCHKIQIQQVFQNLISNAIKFADKPETKIEVGQLEQTDNNLPIYYVKDNGPGIEKRFFEKIFLLFQTLHSKDTIESTGIGLAIVKKIVENHGGKVWLESEVGKGTTFYFSIKPCEVNNK